MSDIDIVERLLEEIKQCALELEEAANVFDGTNFPGLARIYRAASTRARAALAQQPLSSPAGWKLVPIEPTDAMIEAGRMARMNIAGGYGGPGGWEAMLSAAPTVGAKE